MTEAADKNDYKSLYWIEKGVGDVEFDRENTENQVVRSLIRLREKNFTKEIEFTVKGVAWTESIAREMILTFEHYVNSGRQWKEAVFDELFYQEDMSPHLQFVFEAPVTSQLFRKVTYRNRLRTFHGQIEKQFAIACSFILRNGRQLEMAEVADVENWLSDEPRFYLSEGCHVTLVASFASPRLGLRHGRSSSKYRKKLGAALCFEFLTPNLTDSEAFLLVRSLISHRSLKRLRLSHLEFGDATTSAICCLLATPNRQLLDLYLSDHHIEDIPVERVQFDFERFYEWLPVNKSVQSLTFGTLDYIDNDSTNQFLQRLWKFPNLRLLCVDNFYIDFTDFVRLASNVTMTTPPSRLQVLDIGWRTSGVPIGDGHSTVRAILHLLDVFPELCDFGPEFADAIRDGVMPSSLGERLDLNRCCGMLPRGAPTVAPLSIWPVVLAKATRNRHISQSKRANVIYRILQGPVFAERNPLDHERFK